MEYIIICLSLAASSFAIEIINEKRLEKYLAANGYVINKKNFKDFSCSFVPKNNMKSLLLLLVPGYNIYLSIGRVLKYNESEPMILSTFVDENLILLIDKDLRVFLKDNPKSLKKVIKYTNDNPIVINEIVKNTKEHCTPIKIQPLKDRVNKTNRERVRTDERKSA